MAEKKTKEKEENKVLYIVCYLFGWVSGLVLLVTVGKENPKMKFHAMQSILLNAVSIILMFLWFLLFIPMLLGFLLYLYGLYVGYKEYKGVTVKVPYLGTYAEKFAQQA